VAYIFYDLHYLVDGMFRLIVNRDLLNRLERFLEKFARAKNTLILVTDLESLHPYLRRRTMERELPGKFRAPTVFLCPSTRTGKTRLKFPGFYKDDGDYRSVHIGG
jgi:2-phospho-L-lactate guanylyltransferase (CobY/MobA/RfbA family)